MTPEAIIAIIEENQNLRDQLAFVKAQLEDAIIMLREKTTE